MIPNQNFYILRRRYIIAVSQRFHEMGVTHSHQIVDGPEVGGILTVVNVTQTPEVEGAGFLDVVSL